MLATDVGTALEAPRKRPTSKWLSRARSGATWPAGPGEASVGELGFESHVVAMGGLDAARRAGGRTPSWCGHPELCGVTAS